MRLTQVSPLLVHYSQEHWKDYFVEFRDKHPDLRIQEYLHAYSYVLNKSSHTLPPLNIRDQTQENFRSGITGQASCIKVKLPNDEVAKDIASRCCLIRFIFDAWGTASDVAQLNVALENNLRSTVTPFIDSLSEEEKRAATWAVTFYHPGKKIGYDVAGKHEMLGKIKSTLFRLPGKVRLKDPKYEFVFYEDWTRYYEEYERLKARTGSSSIHSDDSDEEDRAISYLDEVDDSSIVPTSITFGRIIARGNDAHHIYDLRHRPFLGTTTMKASVAHVAAVFAMLDENCITLDPFCGTGSTLIAAASLGSAVIGTDVDCEGMPEYEKESEMIIAPSVHMNSTKFKKSVYGRKTDVLNQQEKNVLDNFVAYGLKDRLIDLFSLDAIVWLFDDVVDAKSFYSLPLLPPRITEMKFNAIVTDPPFGKREIFFNGDDVSENGNHLELDGKKNVWYWRWKRIRSNLRQFSSFVGERFAHMFPEDHNNPPSSSLESSAATTMVTSSSFIPLDSLMLLLLIAEKRLLPGGKLVFWLPTASNVTSEDVQDFLQSLLSYLNEVEGVKLNLSVSSMVYQRLFSGMWRWICILEKSDDVA